MKTPKAMREIMMRSKQIVMGWRGAALRHRRVFLVAALMVVFAAGLAVGLCAEKRFGIVDRIAHSFVPKSTQKKPVPKADQIHWTILGPEAVAFHWRGTETVIRYGEQSGVYPETASAAEPAPIPTSSKGPYREAKLENLKPDTLYYYTLGDTAATFRTPSVGWTRPFTVAAEADIGTSKRAEGVQTLIAEAKPDFVLAVGDLTYANQGGQNRVDKHFNIVSSWAHVAAYMPIWGNHEFKRNDPTENYTGRFILPNVGALTSSRQNGENITAGEDWYWFDYSHTRFITYPEPASETDAEWKEWAKVMESATSPLAAAQKDSKISFVVIFGHRPAYSSGKEDGEPALAEALTQLAKRYPKLVLVLNGHSHNYERALPPGGVTYVTVGTGGESLQHQQDVPAGGCLWRVCPPPDWSAKRYFRFGYLKLAFEKEKIAGQFVCGPDDDDDDPLTNRSDVECREGDVIDTFDIKPRR